MIVRHRICRTAATILSTLAFVACPSGQPGADEGAEGANTATTADTTSEALRPLERDTMSELPVQHDTIDSGLEGRVTIGPTCPAQEIGRECPARPYAATLLIKDAASGEVLHRIRSDQEGRFRLALPAGSYVVEPAAPELVSEPRAEPVSVTVRPGQWAWVRVRFDSGAR